MSEPVPCPSGPCSVSQEGVFSPLSPGEIPPLVSQKNIPIFTIQPADCPENATSEDEIDSAEFTSQTRHPPLSPLLQTHLCTGSDKEESDTLSPLLNSPPALHTPLRSDSSGYIESSITVKGVVYHNPVEFAEQLSNRDLFQGSEVAQYLCKKSTFGVAIAVAYLNQFDFTGMTIDAALRLFLDTFCLIGETHDKARILERFAERFYQQNQNRFSSLDSVNTLAFSVILLNTDLHNVNVEEKMSLKDFIKNNKNLNDGKDFPLDLLKQIYYSIKQNEIRTPVDEEEFRRIHSGNLAKDASSPPSSLCSPPKSLVTSLGKAASSALGGFKKKHGSTNLLKLASANTTFTLSARDVPSLSSMCSVQFECIISKKELTINSEKVASPRTWRKLKLIFSDHYLYFYFVSGSKRDSPESGILVRHGLAEEAKNYSKKPFVFRFLAADGHSCFIQTNSKEEMESLILVINTTACIYSRPPLSAPVSSKNLQFTRPILPTTASDLSLTLQYNYLLQKIEDTRKELEDVKKKRSFFETQGAEGSKSYYNQESFLYTEICRYSVYVKMMKEHLKTCPESSLSP